MIWLGLALLAAFLKSLVNISEKEVLSKEEADIYVSAFSLVIAFVSLPLLFFVGPIALSGMDSLIIFAASLVSVISSLTAAYAIKRLDISESSGLFALSPLLVTVFAVIFLHENIVPLQALGIGLSVIGIYIIEHRFGHHTLAAVHPPIEITPEPVHKRGLPYTLLTVSLVAFSLSVIADRYIIHERGIHPLVFLVVVQFFVLFNFVLYDITAIKALKRKVINPQLFLQPWFWLSVIVVVAHRIVHVFAASGMQASVLNAIKQINAVFTAFIGGKLFTEKHVIRRTIGCVCIAAGVCMVAFYSL